MNKLKNAKFYKDLKWFLKTERKIILAAASFSLLVTLGLPSLLNRDNDKNADYNDTEINTYFSGPIEKENVSNNEYDYENNETIIVSSPPNEFFRSPDGDLWTSKDEFATSWNTTKQTPVSPPEMFIAPDDSRWTSEAEWKAWVELQNNPPLNDNFFVDPNGNLWTSEAEFTASWGTTQPAPQVDETYNEEHLTK